MLKLKLIEMNAGDQSLSYTDSYSKCSKYIPIFLMCSTSTFEGLDIGLSSNEQTTHPDSEAAMLLRSPWRCPAWYAAAKPSLSRGSYFDPSHCICDLAFTLWSTLKSCKLSYASRLATCIHRKPQCVSVPSMKKEPDV
jgi:hypothetical protein